jgi:RNA polymerase sigma-70 factor (ECF subfamily)
MSPSSPPAKSCHCGQVEAWLANARAGSRDALGALLETYRRWLLLVANREIDPDLRAKVAPSDLVQETFLEAQVHFNQFAGQTEREFLAWLQGILKHRAADWTRRFRHTEKRAISREVRLNDARAQDDLAAPAESPSWQAIALEEAEQLQGALRRLPEPYLQVILLHNRDGRSFAEVGTLMNRSADAARMLWVRAFKQLQQELGPDHERS